MSSHGSRAIPSLDGLRAISIALVVFAHTAALRPTGLLHRIAARLDIGILGVRVFFVISGFLITSLLLDEERRTQTISLAHFYFRRFLRIFPPFYAYLACNVIAVMFGVVQTPTTHLALAAVYLCNYITVASWYVGHSWSLSIEEQFYLVWPLLLVLAGRRRAMHGAIAFLVLAPLARIGCYVLLPDLRWGLDRWFPLVADALAVGCVLAGLKERLHASDAYRRFQASPLFLLVPLAVGVADSLLIHPFLYYAVCVTVMNVGIALTIDWCIVHKDGLIGRALNARPVRFVGVLSYSIYLWQQPFLSSRADFFGHLPAWGRVLGLIVVPLASYFLIEKTFLSLRARLERRWLPATP